MASPKVELFLFSCFNFWAWENPKKKNTLLRRVCLDTAVSVKQVFNLVGKKYVPKKKIDSNGCLYGRVGRGALNTQRGSVIIDYVIPELLEEYLKKQK